MSRAAFVTLFAALFAAPLAAQTVRGTAAAADGGGRVPGVVVLLLDAEGATVRRALTDERGAFTLVAPAPGRYTVRALRIGFRPTVVEGVTLAAGESRPLELRLTNVPAVLERVVVSASRGCRQRADAGTAAADLWEAARTALLAQQLTAASRAYDLRWVTSDQWQALGARTPSRERTEAHGGYSLRAFASVPADTLAARGYVYSVPGGDLLYHGPDAEVLLSDRFARDHCFSVVASPDSAQRLVGLAFRPPQRRGGSLVDVRGVLWVDRATSELRHIEFAYEGLPVEHEEVGRGRVDYLRLPDGAWIIREWSIRMPVMHALTLNVPDGALSRTTRRRELRVAEVQVATGALVDVRSGPRTLWSSRTARVTGSVPPSAAPDVRLVLLDGVSPPRRVHPAADGRFVVDSLSPRPHRLVVTAPAMDSLGVAADTIHVTPDSAAPPAVTVQPPTIARLVRRLCGDEARDTAARVATGVVRGADGRPAPRARVVARWEVPKVTANVLSAVTLDRAARADGEGRFTLCGLPTDRAIELRVEDGRVRGPAVVVRLSPLRAYQAATLRAAGAGG